MNAAWDGLPQNPERDGWHWVEHIETREASVWLWRAGLDDWVGMEPSEWRYLGPCLTPADIARKDAALQCARIKLSRYRQYHPDTWIGGVQEEYTAVISLIDAALAPEPGA